MAVTVKKLIASQQVANSTTTYYTATNVKTIIDKFTVCNPTAGAATITVYLVDSGGSAGDSETIISAKSVGAGETYTFPEIVGHTLNASDFIQCIASAATTLTLRASGREIT